MTMLHDQIRCVFFDLGGTLFRHLPAKHTEKNVLAAFTRQGWCDSQNQAARVLDSYQQHRRQVEQEGAYQAFFLHRGVVAEAMRRTLQEFGLPQGDAPTHFCDAQRNSVTSELQLRADTASTLLQLRQQGVWCGIVSNIDEDYIVPLMARTGLAQHFDYWISSERARSCKPHTGIYRLALTHSGFQPHQVLFVGDSLVNDVQGPRRLGMRTALLTADLADAPPAGADIYIETLSALVPLLNPAGRRG